MPYESHFGSNNDVSNAVVLHAEMTINHANYQLQHH